LRADKRIKKVTVRFTEDEYEKYLSLFKRIKSDYTQSEFIRNCIFDTVPPKLIAKQTNVYKPTACHKERVRQIAGLSNNINQIAKNLNILMKSGSQSNLLAHLKKLDTIYTYCEAAMFEKTK